MLVVERRQNTFDTKSFCRSLRNQHLLPKFDQYCSQRYTLKFYETIVYREAARRSVLSNFSSETNLFLVHVSGKFLHSQQQNKSKDKTLCFCDHHSDFLSEADRTNGLLQKTKVIFFRSISVYDKIQYGDNTTAKSTKKMQKLTKNNKKIIKLTKKSRYFVLNQWGYL